MSGDGTQERQERAERMQAQQRLVQALRAADYDVHPAAGYDGTPGTWISDKVLYSLVAKLSKGGR